MQQALLPRRKPRTAQRVPGGRKHAAVHTLTELGAAYTMQKTKHSLYAALPVFSLFLALEAWRWVYGRAWSACWVLRVPLACFAAVTSCKEAQPSQGAGALAQHRLAKLAVRALCGIAGIAGLHQTCSGLTAASQAVLQHPRGALGLKVTLPEHSRLASTMGGAKRKAAEPAAKPAKKPAAESAEAKDAAPSSSSDASKLPLQVNPKRVQKLRDGQIGEGPVIYWCTPV